MHAIYVIAIFYRLQQEHITETEDGHTEEVLVVYVETVKDWSHQQYVGSVIQK